MNNVKQPIYDALNWMGGAMPCNKPEDSVLIINAYEKVYKLPDKETQKLFLDLIQRLRYRDATIEKLIAAWDKSATQLCNAVKAIDNQNK